MDVRNLLADLPDARAAEVFETLLVGRNARVERIVSHGQASPPGFWYDQAQHEWILLLAGAARLQFEEGEIELRPGDAVPIAAHRRHRVAWTAPDEPTIWLAVYYEA